MSVIIFLFVMTQTYIDIIPVSEPWEGKDISGHTKRFSLHLKPRATDIHGHPHSQCIRQSSANNAPLEWIPTFSVH